MGRGRAPRSHQQPYYKGSWEHSLVLDDRLKQRKAKARAKERKVLRSEKLQAPHLTNCSCRQCIKADPLSSSSTVDRIVLSAPAPQKFKLCLHQNAPNNCFTCTAVTFLCCMAALRHDKGLVVPKGVLKMIALFARSQTASCNRCLNPVRDEMGCYEYSHLVNRMEGLYIVGNYGSILDNDLHRFIGRDGLPLSSKDARKIYLPKRPSTIDFRKVRVCNDCAAQMLYNGEIRGCGILGLGGLSI